MIKAAIVGSTGYVGEELVRILLQHPEVEISNITSQSYLNKPYNQAYESFRNIFDKECEEQNIESLAEQVDVIFMALPHGIASKQINSKILEKVKIIDLGADYRLKNKDTYENWYNTEHYSEDLLKEAVYGLCEWKRNQVKTARLVANPGCYTTCSILSIVPLLKENILEENSIIIDAKSGVTGAGRSANLSSHFVECNESIKAYKIASHRHTPEIEQELSEASGKSIKVTFTPHLIPMNRGILTTAYGNLKENLSYQDIRDIYEKYYKDEHFIRLIPENAFPETRWVKNSNYCDIGFTIDRRSNRIIIIGAIDNLIKGAAGQAVQNMNILFGFDEKTGISMIPSFA